LTPQTPHEIPCHLLGNFTGVQGGHRTCFTELFTRCESYSQWLDFFQKLDYIIIKMSEKEKEEQKRRVLRLYNLRRKAGIKITPTTTKTPFYANAKAEFGETVN